MNGTELSTQDILTIVGAVIGLVCGLMVGAQTIYSKLYDSNYIDANDWKNSEQNKLDPKTRLIIGLVGGFFFAIGIVFMVLFFMGVGNDGGDDKIAISSGAFVGTLIGGMVLYVAIVGKKAT